MPELQMDELIFREPLRLPDNASSSGEIDLSVYLLRSFQKISVRHLKLLGYGNEEAKARGAFWAIVKTTVQILTVPAPEDGPVLETWPGKNTLGAFWRHFRVRSDSGAVLVRAASLWVLMDVQTRTLSRCPSWAASMPKWHEDDELPSRFGSIRFPEDVPQIDDCCVPKDRIDENGHLNNAFYPLLAENALSGKRPDGTLREFSIEYRHELLPDQAFRLLSVSKGRAVFLRGAGDSKEYFTMRWEYDPI